MKNVIKNKQAVTTNEERTMRMNYLSDYDVKRIFKNNREQFSTALTVVKIEAKLNRVSDDVIDVIISPAYAKPMIETMIMCIGMFENDDDLIVQRVIEVMPQTFSAEMEFLSVYNHPREYISEKDCPAAAKFRKPVYTAYEAKSIFEANKEKWDDDIISVYSPIVESLPEYNRDFLLQEVNNCCVYALMYGSRQIHPLENIKRGLEHELRCCITLNALDTDINQELDDALN